MTTRRQELVREFRLCATACLTLGSAFAVCAVWSAAEGRWVSAAALVGIAAVPVRVGLWYVDLARRHTLGD
jgi:hypothetical protein